MSEIKEVVIKAKDCPVFKPRKITFTLNDDGTYKEEYEDICVKDGELTPYKITHNRVDLTFKNNFRFDFNYLSTKAVYSLNVERLIDHDTNEIFTITIPDKQDAQGE